MMTDRVQAPDRGALLDLVLASLRDVLAVSGQESLPVDGNTRLLGRNAVLDSMGLVNLIVDVEQCLEDSYGLVLVLADAQAMSRSQSPFRSVTTLVEYICERIGD